MTSLQYKCNIKKIKKHWQFYLLILVPLLLVIVFGYIPMYGILYSFQDFNPVKGVLGSPWVGFKHFERFFSSAMFWVLLRNTLAISLYSLIAGLPIPIMLAIGLNELKNKTFKKTVQLVTYAPYFISTVVVVGMMMQFLNPNFGMVNKIFTTVGLEPINFMGKPEFFRSIYVWSGIWQFAGYSSVIYLAVLSTIDQSLYEASIVDGASKLQKIWHIDIPGLMPTVIILLIMSVGQIMNVGFEKTFLMQNALNTQVSEVISTYVYKVGFSTVNFSYSTAIGFFNSIINCILLVGVNQIARKVGDTSLW